MDENQKLLENPQQSSKKTLVLVLIFALVAVVLSLTFLKNKSNLSISGQNNTVTPEDQMRRLAETPSTGDNPSVEEQGIRLKESPSTNEGVRDMTYEDQLEILKNN